MEKSKAFLELTQEESDRVSSLDFLPIPTGAEFSLYECYALRGIRVDRLESDRVFCTFKVPPRLTVSKSLFFFFFLLEFLLHGDQSLFDVNWQNREGKLAAGAIANLIDAVGAGCVNIGGHPVNVSVDMSISFHSSAKIDVSISLILPIQLSSLLVYEFSENT